MSDPDSEAIDASEERSRNNRAALLVSAGSCTIAFTVGFNYGAFGTVFFDAILAVWVLSTVVLVGSLLTSLPPNSWVRRVILLLPTLWIVTAWIDNQYDVQNLDNAIVVITLVVTVIALPFAGWFLVTAISPDFAELPSRHKTAVVTATLTFIVIGYAMGALNDQFLTCDDFKVSGNDLPANCRDA